MSSHRRTTARWKLYLASIFLLLLLLLGVAELTVRVMGYSAWQQPSVDFQVDGAPGIFVPDSLLGYRGRPGQLVAHLDQQLTFPLNHGPDGFRQCPTSPTADSLPEIWFLGCSFTHGFGVSDADCFPCLVQQAFPEVRVRNLGMSGYGTLQFLLVLRQELEKRPAPALVVVGHGAFHQQRNTANRNWRKALAGREVADGIRYPYAEWQGNGLYAISYTDLAYEPWPAMRWSALVHFLEQRSNAAQDQELHSKELTRVLLKQIIETAAAHESDVLLAGIHHHPETASLLRSFRQDGVPAVDISQDMRDESLRILPEDQHPNALGHRKMADLLIDYLKSAKWKP